MKRWSFPRILAPGAARADREREIREEIEHYLDLRTEELVEGGMDPDAARREAEARFGDPDVIERRVRREAGPAGGGGGMGMLIQDVRYALRTFRRNPGFTLVATTTLALALAGNTTIFSVLDAAVLRALPFPDSDRLVFVNGVHRPEGGEVAVRMASVPEFMDWRERSRTVDPMVGVDPNSLTLSGDGEAERVSAEMVSRGFFELLGGRAALGRVFAEPEYETPDGYPVVVISHAFWQRRFGGDPTLVGRTIVLNDRSMEVVGVMPPSFQSVGTDVDLWFPLGMISVVTSPQMLEQRGNRFLPVIGRLAAGSDVDGAQRELDGITSELEASFPDINEDRAAEVMAFRDGFLGDTSRLLWILFGAGALLLVIASANVANLLLVRANARTRELVLRRAVGAQSHRVARQLLTESVVLSMAGGIVGLIVAAIALRVLMPMLPDGVLPAYVRPELSPRVFAFTFVVLGFVGLAAGMAPALSSARRDIAGALRSGGRAVAGGRMRTQQVFVVTQVGLALLLLIGAGLLTRSFRAQMSVDPGMDIEDVHVFRVQPPVERYPDGDALRAFADDLQRSLSATPGVDAVAVSSDFPFRGRSSGSYIVRPDDVETLIRYHRHSVTPGYFEMLGTEVRAGRLLTDRDVDGSAGVVVVTDALVRRVFPEDPNPIGRSLFVGNPANPENLAEIVGIVEDVRYRNLTQDMMDGPNSPDVFFAFDQVPARTLEVSYRTSRSAGGPTAATVRQAVAEIDRAIPVFLPQSLEEAYRAQTATPRFAAFLMGLFSLLALSLASVGIYGVLAFTVGQRGQEIAVRRALGAGAGDVARGVVADGLRMAVLGLIVGAGAAYLGGSVLDAFLFDVPARDPVTLASTTALMLAVAVVAAGVPAWRAARKSPADALGGD